MSAAKQIHKLIVSHRAALQGKYTAASLKTIDAAVKALIAADRGRGLTTDIIYLDDKVALKAAGGTAVGLPAAEPAVKAAIDALFTKHQPDYLMILGAPDVVPMQTLRNPIPGAGSLSVDADSVVPSDLPYACAAKYSANISAFRAPTRVVGRLPDIVGGSDPKYLVGLLGVAAAYRSSAPGTYSSFFGLSAQVWQKSTQLSVAAAFGTAAGVLTSPPSGPAWTKAQLKPSAHFINCHGASVATDYYGQPASGPVTFPVAMMASGLKARISPGTVAAAECCYGAQLFDPTLTGGQIGIAGQYLEEGAYGFVGSTTISYGPASTNDLADLICQFFFRRLLPGASLGSALLQARQDYLARKGTRLTPYDLKTLAQFYLLGDPAIHPVSLGGSGGADSADTGTTAMAKTMRKVGSGFRALAAPGYSDELSRRERRLRQAERGAAVAKAAPVMKLTERKLPAALSKAVGSALQDLGVIGPIQEFTCQEATRPRLATASAANLAKGMATSIPKAVHFMVGRIAGSSDVERTPALAGVQVIEYADGLVVEPFFSR